MGIRILIADDYTLIRQGIKRVLEFEGDFEVAGEAEDGQEALARTLMLQPDILLLDAKMPGLDSLDVVERLVQAGSKAKIIVLSPFDNNDMYLLEYLKEGAKGFLEKNTEPQLLVRAIREVNQGQSYIQPRLAQRLFGGQQNLPSDTQKWAQDHWEETREERLTAREHDVLICIARGLSNQDIGRVLDLSEKTVKNHLTNIFRKLHVNDRTQALICALKHHIIDLK